MSQTSPAPRKHKGRKRPKGAYAGDLERHVALLLKDKRSTLGTRLDQYRESFADDLRAPPNAAEQSVIDRAALLSLLLDIDEVRLRKGALIDGKAYADKALKLAQLLGRLGTLRGTGFVSKGRKPRTIDAHAASVIGSENAPDDPD